MVKQLKISFLLLTYFQLLLQKKYCADSVKLTFPMLFTTYSVDDNIKILLLFQIVEL